MDIKHIDWSEAPAWANRVIRPWVDKALVATNAWANDREYQYISGSFRFCLDDLPAFRLVENRPDDWKEGEERMNNIAQNGNDGHYAELDSVSETLKERGTRYGEFSDVAETTQSIKAAMYRGSNAEALSAVHWEALSMIASKIARIVNGDPNYNDNWHDIGGYSKLVEDEIAKLEKEK